MLINIPNTLTIARLILIPVFVGVFYLPFSWGHIAAAIIFAIAALTDWLDGMLARQLNQTSSLGAFLDPVADKLMVATALVLLVGEKYFYYITIPAAIIMCREIVISALREWMAELGKRASVAVSVVAKFKTFVQMLALTFLLAYQPSTDLRWILIGGYILLYLAAFLTLWSMIMYLRAAWPELTLSDQIN